jgi:cell division protein FtsB
MVLVILLGGLLFTSAYPLRRYLEVRHSIRSLHAEDRALDAKIAELRRQHGLLQTPAEITRIAREELGMVRPGEIPFVVLPATPRSLPAVSRAPAGPARSSLFARWWDAVTRAAGALR